MRMNLKALASPLLAFALFAPTGTAGAQTKPESQQVAAGQPEVHELVLRDGSRVYGSIERETDSEVVFRTHAGATVTARRADIVSLRRVKGRVEGGEFRRSDAHSSRLFFAPTGRSLEKGQVSIGAFGVVAPFVQVGVTDRFSVGGGTPLMFGFEEDFRPFWVTPKYQVVNQENVQAAVGVLHVFNVSGDSGGIAYGVSTYGNSDNALTLGAGLAYSGGDVGGMAMIGGERRVRSNLKVISENYLLQSGDGIISGGVRFLGERLSADLALAFPIGLGDFAALPVVNFMYVF